MFNTVALLATLALGYAVYAVFEYFQWRAAMTRDGVVVAAGAMPVMYHIIPILRSLSAEPFGTFGWFVDNTLTAGGRPWTVRIPGHKVSVSLVDPADVSFILNDVERFPKGPYFRNLFDILLGEGIFNADGDSWRRQRKVASHMFSVKSLRYMDNVFVKHARELIARLSKSVGAVIDVQATFAEFTLRSFTEIAFGLTLEPAQLDDFAFRFNRATRGAHTRSSLVWWEYIPYEAERHLRADTDWLKKFAADLVHQRRSDMANGTWVAADREDLLTRMMTIVDEDDEQEDVQAAAAAAVAVPADSGRVASGTSRVAEAEARHDKLLYDSVINFILAGRDTTAQALTWMSYLLACHPDVERKLTTEIRAAFPPGGEEPHYDSLKKLNYLHQCVAEALRLYPSVPLDAKESTEDTVLPSGVTVRAGTMLIWPGWVLGRDPRFWHEPERFKPERWEGPEQNGGKPLPPSTGTTPPFVPFQSGPRTCLGIQMAYSEIKLMISMLILAGVRFATTSDKHPMLVRALTLAARDGVPLRVVGGAGGKE